MRETFYGFEPDENWDDPNDEEYDYDEEKEAYLELAWERAREEELFDE